MPKDVKTKTDKNPYTLSIIIILVFFTVLIVAVLWLTLASIRDTGYSGTTPLNSPQGLNYRCSTIECDPNTSCDSVFQLCKLNVGEKCTDGSQCLSGSYCSGVCTNKDPAYVTGNVNDPCPCPKGMSCTKDVYSDNRICKKNYGQHCDEDTECLSDQCYIHTCTNGKSLGQPCNSGSTTECAAGLECSTAPGDSIGYCQNIGTETGTIGAYCNVENKPGCETSTTCMDNKCVPSAQGLADPCVADEIACSLPLICVNTYNFSDCEADDVSCICGYPYTQSNFQNRPDPNSCSETGTCSGNTTIATCQANNFCTGIKYYPCSKDSQCDASNSSVCRSTLGGIYMFTFDYYSVDPVTQRPIVVNSSSPLNILSSTNVYYQRYSVMPNISMPNIYVSKLIGYSDKVKDYVYYIIPYNSGNPGITGLFDSTGKSVIPGYYSTSDSQGTLIERKFLDATLNSDSNFTPIGYALFIETWTPTIGSPTINHTVYTFNPVTLQLVPYSPYAGTGLVGTQFYMTGFALSPDQIVVSSKGDIILGVGSNTAGSLSYVKNNSGNGTYVIMTNAANGTNVTGFNKLAYYNVYYKDGVVENSIPPCGLGSSDPSKKCYSRYDVTYSTYADYYYTDTSVSYNVGKVVVFNGAAAGALFPYYQYTDPTGLVNPIPSRFDVIDYSIYTSNDLRQDSDDSTVVLNDGYSILCVTDVNSSINMVCVVVDGILGFLPGYVTLYTRVLALRHGCYLYSQNVCGTSP